MDFQYLTATCSCGNDLLLAPGSTCDVCMGQVPDPEIAAEDTDTQFGVDYFEALEQDIAQRDWAA